MNNHAELELKLRRKIRKTKIIHALIAMAFVVIGIIFAVIRENTKEIYMTDFPFGTQISRETVIYNADITFLMGISFTIAAIFLVMLGLVCIFAKINTVEVEGNYITLYRGAVSTVLYVNGKPADRTGYYLEAPLADGSKVTVALSRNTFFAHMTFSNGHPPIDL